MIRRKDFMESIGMPDEGFNAAMDRALLQIAREERRPQVKSKMRLSLIAAVIAVIALSASAVAAYVLQYSPRQDVRMSANISPIT